jgi:hypothetical protein
MLDRQPTNSYVSSIIALALGIVLAVGVSAFFGLIGWGGEWASQVAGATSGAGEASRRWILLGISIYAVMRIAILLASGPSDIPGFSTAAIVAGVFVTLPLMAGISLLGARRAAHSSRFLRADLPPSAAAGGSRRGFGAARRNRRRSARLRSSATKASLI